jgi:nucleoid DNA-binding protein
MALTQPQLLAVVADRAEFTKADAKRVLDALGAVALEELGDAQKVRIGGLVQLTVRVKPAQKKRPGRNPRPARRSRSPPSPPASMSAPVR